MATQAGDELWLRSPRRRVALDGTLTVVAVALTKRALQTFADRARAKNESVLIRTELIGHRSDVALEVLLSVAGIGVLGTPAAVAHRRVVSDVTG